MMNNPLPSSPAHREAGLTLGDLMQSFTLEESFKMAYLPVILTKSAFEYARFAHRICVEKRLSFNKPCREIRQRTGKPYAARIPKECADLRRALMSIAGAYRMDHTGTLRTAIIALANKANSMIKVTVTR